jgi:hypothetical protein
MMSAGNDKTTFWNILFAFSSISVSCIRTSKRSFARGAELIRLLAANLVEHTAISVFTLLSTQCTKMISKHY